MKKITDTVEVAEVHRNIQLNNDTDDANGEDYNNI